MYFKNSTLKVQFYSHTSIIYYLGNEGTDYVEYYCGITYTIRYYVQRWHRVEVQRFIKSYLTLDDSSSKMVTDHYCLYAGNVLALVFKKNVMRHGQESANQSTKVKVNLRKHKQMWIALGSAGRKGIDKVDRLMVLQWIVVHHHLSWQDVCQYLQTDAFSGSSRKRASGRNKHCQKHCNKTSLQRWWIR